MLIPLARVCCYSQARPPSQFPPARQPGPAEAECLHYHGHGVTTRYVTTSGPRATTTLPQHQHHQHQHGRYRPGREAQGARGVSQVQERAQAGAEARDGAGVGEILEKGKLPVTR